MGIYGLRGCEEVPEVRELKVGLMLRRYDNPVAELRAALPTELKIPEKDSPGC